MDSAIQPDHAPIFAVEQAGELLAAASAPDDGPGVASVGVVTHSAWRGKGYGTAVVSALTADRLANGVVLHYQTLRANAASVAIARALGYHDLATALGIRLRA
jgi:predicted GNAT family acetyltransferase